jgi:hypothetical protein
MKPVPHGIALFALAALGRSVAAAPPQPASEPTPPINETPAPATIAAPAAARPSPPPRGEIILGVGLFGGGTSWRGDATTYGSLRLGLRLFRILTPYVQARLGYGAVDERMLTLLSVGLELGLPVHERLYLRSFVAWVHQHEESGAAIADQPAGAFLGIGGGIRHRAGVQTGLGLDVVVFRRRAYAFTVGVEGVFAWLTYSSGPSLYGLAGVTAGGQFRLF